jgi:hypothetical protein
MAAKTIIGCTWQPISEAPVTITSAPAPVFTPEERQELWRLYFHEADQCGSSHDESVLYADLMTR